ncbi:cTAGE family member 5 [Sciurus carolinensis]|uniref:CTAGE family member 5 n=1 Tax=Sciurus carolinensis TaxID=30640 RepID=A0AA41N0X5_SCICA|nr:cTAGE family member 5 [Sciurus carolinensis]
MKDGAVPGEDLTDDDNLKLEVKSESEIGAHLGNQPKGALKELVHAVKLNPSLKTLGERNQIYTSLSEVDETKEDLTEHIKNLQTEGESLRSENTQLENENQKLQQKLKLMIELYKENKVKLLGKLIAEEKCRFEEKERLCKVDIRISLAAKQLETCRKQAKDLEEELESTIHFFERQILFYENKVCDDDLVASTAGRNREYLRKVNAHNRQKLPEIEFEFKSLEKDPYTLDVSNTVFGREHTLYGPSPSGRVSSEMRAFHLERKGALSPLLPGEGGRGSGGPEKPLDRQISNKRRESCYDGLTDPQRAPADTLTLSLPW